MKGRLALILAALAVPAALFAADVFSEYKLDQDQARENLFYAVRGGLTGPPEGARNLKQVPEGQRAAVVNALGAFAKAYFKSDAFKQRYQGVYEAGLPKKPQPPFSTTTQGKKTNKQIESQIKMMERSLEMMPEEVQADMKKQIAEMKKMQAGQDPQTAKDKARYDKELAEYNQKMADPKLLPKDPNVLLKRRLTDFLAQTASINYEAKLTADGYRKHFADKTLEAKPEEWKMWFRAGKEATSAARAFATDWLKELK
jgi:hypothetical protein